MLGSTPIMEDTDYVKLGEFSYRGFETTTIRRLDKVAQVAETGFEWESGLATISARGVPMRDYYLPIAVEDETGWKKVERFVERWMRNYKHDIKVKLVIVYKKTKRTDGASSDEEDMRSKKVYSSKVALIFSVPSFEWMDRQDIYKNMWVCCGSWVASLAAQ